MSKSYGKKSLLFELQRAGALVQTECFSALRSSSEASSQTRSRAPGSRATASPGCSGCGARHRALRDAHVSRQKAGG